MLRTGNKSLEDQLAVLKHHDYLFGMILSNIPQSIYFKDVEGRYTGVSRSIVKKFGLSDEKELIGQTDESFFSKTFYKTIRERELKVTETGTPVIDEETEEFWSDGTKTYSINSMLPLKDEDGKITGIIGISTDITKQKEADFALQNNLRFLEVLINTLPTPIYYKDLHGQFQGCNDAFTRLVGKKRDELIGNTVIDIFPKEIAGEMHAYDMSLLKQKGTQSFEVRLGQKSGKNSNLIFHQASFIDHDNLIVGLVGGIVNITDQRVNEQKLAEYTEELQTTNSNKDRFFSIIAHDLKNPFITLLGYTEALIDDYAQMNPEEHLEYLKQIQTTSKNSYQLLENLLQWSRSQSGRLKIEKNSFNLYEVVAEVASLKETSYNSKQLTFQNNVDKYLSVFADKDMVKTILRNLIANSIKFTNEKGNINVASYTEDEFVVTYVEDNGIGITEETMKDIFNIDKFQSTAGTRNEEGTGLGLVLCREFVTKNSGEIWVESEPEKGSKFFFKLPLGK